MDFMKLDLKQSQKVLQMAPKGARCVTGSEVPKLGMQLLHMRGLDRTPSQPLGRSALGDGGRDLLEGDQVK